MPKILIIGFVWPEPKSSAAGRRMLQLIEALQYRGNPIKFISACAKSQNAFDLKSLGVNTKNIELNNSSFDSLIKNENPDYVIFDRFMTEEQFGWRVAENCPRAIRILDTEDLQFLRRGREEALKSNETSEGSYLTSEIAKREIASIYRCDLSLIISEFEMDLLKTKFNVPDGLLFYLPFMEEPIDLASTESFTKYIDRKHFMTVGNFMHKPNGDAVKLLKRIIWPKIREEIPEAELHIYGAYESQQFREMNDPQEGFLVKGYVNDIAEAIQGARVCLAPLQFGAGLKGKLIDAMNNGTPCVTTEIGAEGMYDVLEPNGFVANDWNEFSNLAVQLYSNQEVWQEKQANGFVIINERFNKQEFTSKFIDRLISLRADIEIHRQENFIGSLLHHHTLQSTKYMSRWIEEKNKTKDA